MRRCYLVSPRYIMLGWLQQRVLPYCTGTHCYWEVPQLSKLDGPKYFFVSVSRHVESPTSLAQWDKWNWWKQVYYYIIETATEPGRPTHKNETKFASNHAQKIAGMTNLHCKVNDLLLSTQLISKALYITSVFFTVVLIFFGLPWLCNSSLDFRFLISSVQKTNQNTQVQHPTTQGLINKKQSGSN